MWYIEAIDRQTCETTVENYASFDSYDAAREYADRHEMEARVCGWTWVVRFKAE